MRVRESSTKCQETDIQLEWSERERERETDRERQRDKETKERASEKQESNRASHLSRVDPVNAPTHRVDKKARDHDLLDVEPGQTFHNHLHLHPGVRGVVEFEHVVLFNFPHRAELPLREPAGTDQRRLTRTPRIVWYGSMQG